MFKFSKQIVYNKYLCNALICTTGSFKIKKCKNLSLPKSAVCADSVCSKQFYFQYLKPYIYVNNEFVNLTNIYNFASASIGSLYCNYPGSIQIVSIPQFKLKVLFEHFEIFQQMFREMVTRNIKIRSKVQKFWRYRSAKPLLLFVVYI